MNEEGFFNAQKYFMGTTVNAGKSNGYSEINDIDLNDPHYGWELGRFFVSGYTRIFDDGTNAPVFLKTLGDTVTLGFTLEQVIDSLNGDKNVSIGEDKKGYDKYFQIEKSDFGRGALIIRHIDYQNKEGKPQFFTDYLPAVDKGADTVVQLCEEGDYEIALNYAIKKKTLVFSSTTNYRIFFKFSVRNGNCMVYPFDISTKAELTNSSVTGNGFYLDLAKSRYLDIDIKREVYSEGEKGFTEDIRFNRPAKDGDEYTEEGIYTITVRNRYTSEQTIKQICVGESSILDAYNAVELAPTESEESIPVIVQTVNEGSVESYSESSLPESVMVSTADEGLIETLKRVDVRAWVIIVVALLVVILILSILLGRKNRIRKVLVAEADEKEQPRL